ncbi:MAG TPA: hypothetical protein PLT68_00325 [Actinomycetota bacterium]|nr:hypothetical protein [Actinomycetota bacterium]
MAATPERGDAQQFRSGDHTLTATAMDPDLEHAPTVVPTSGR